MELIKDSDPNASFESCHEFICHLIERSPKKVRGPYLARLELHRIMRAEKADAIALLGEYSQLLLEYFRNFGDRNCCPHDLKVFCRHLSRQEYEAFPQQMMAMVSLADDGTSSTEVMMKYICAVQVTRFWDTTDRSTAALEALSVKMLHLYTSYNKRFAGKLLTTDISPCDQFVMLAGECVMDVLLVPPHSFIRRNSFLASSLALMFAINLFYNDLLLVHKHSAWSNTVLPAFICNY